ncbi:hypothetical protein M0R45_008926 [Rubus argutus]|uniref:Uncharacterized protein n=1 Tax=Rubus argutus TaxID=59490 RepID=A0AAW1Y326_RUBAR
MSPAMPCSASHAFAAFNPSNAQPTPQGPPPPLQHEGPDRNEKEMRRPVRIPDQITARAIKPFVLPRRRLLFPFTESTPSPPSPSSSLPIHGVVKNPSRRRPALDALIQSAKERAYGLEKGLEKKN